MKYMHHYHGIVSGNWDGGGIFLFVEAFKHKANKSGNLHSLWITQPGIAGWQAWQKHACIHKFSQSNVNPSSFVRT
jgi:hypothetical protein